MDFGTVVEANAPNGAGGVILITAGHSAVVNGSVLSQVLSGLTGTGNSANQGFDGRTITIQTGCGLEVGGFISSFGRDAGSDRVHLESCLVDLKAGAIVESSGSGNDVGHAPPGTDHPNHCGPNSGVDQTDFRPDKPVGPLGVCRDLGQGRQDRGGWAGPHDPEWSLVDRYLR